MSKDSIIPVQRRTILKAGLALGALQVASPFVVKSLADEPVKVGWVDPFSGTYAALGTSQLNGGKLALAEINAKGGILGRQVQILLKTAPPMWANPRSRLTSSWTRTMWTSWPVRYRRPWRWRKVTPRISRASCTSLSAGMSIR